MTSPDPTLTLSLCEQANNSSLKTSLLLNDGKQQLTCTYFVLRLQGACAVLVVEGQTDRDTHIQWGWGEREIEIIVFCLPGSTSHSRAADTPLFRTDAPSCLSSNGQPWALEETVWLVLGPQDWTRASRCGIPSL